ncbi:Dabb family protein [uncultured Draconibacterium sp.]|uniref:Dabb family protein n=2 Tax=uncultured Draconibacterium sp. TaxID=1573823 RepID=UPI003217BB9D
MKRRFFLGSLGVTTLFGTLFSNKSIASNMSIENCALKEGEIQHMVIFNLSHQKDSVGAQRFIQDGTRMLTGIPVVKNFQAFNQVSKKNKYQYGFSMVFANQADYATYNNHPDHVAFVQNRWFKEVSDFLEIDFEK